ncbi:MAG: hexokinase [Tannerella sp.]|jgi:hexokinase|nr:hexokinase [Tannerella sp.]
MEKNHFELDIEKLKDIALSLQSKVETGLKEENTEILCIPTYIVPKTTGINGKALVLDLGGTNYRVATVYLADGKTTIHPENGWKKDLSIMRSPGFTRDDLHREQADPILEIKRDEEMPIGYCFSYSAESQTNGDVKLLYWTKGVHIDEMKGQPVGRPLLEYLNMVTIPGFTDIKVINDTVASLFAGLADGEYDAYIGLIVGTGTNMATFIDTNRIPKIDPSFRGKGLIPINLESGNFHPPHLTDIDERVDAQTDSKGTQRFEKAVSGMYLGDILRAVFPSDEFEENFDARKLTSILNYPDIYKEKYVKVANWIYERSARLTAASLAGLILVLSSHNPSVKTVKLVAEGSLFWSKHKNGSDYKDLVLEELHRLLGELQLAHIEIAIRPIENANLTGSAIAALS